MKKKRENEDSQEWMMGFFMSLEVALSNTKFTGKQQLLLYKNIHTEWNFCAQLIIMKNIVGNIKKQHHRIIACKKNNIIEYKNYSPIHHELY